MLNVVFTDANMLLPPDEWWHDGGLLQEETAWWTPTGEVYIYTPVYDDDVKRFGALVHEGFELVTINRWKIHNHLLYNMMHYIANMLEIFVTCGRNLRYTNWNWRQPDKQQRKQGSGTLPKKMEEGD